MVSPDEFSEAAERVRRLAGILAERHPGHPMYPMILRHLTAVEAMPDADSRDKSLRGMGVLAVRELDGSSGGGVEYQALADAIFRLCDEARRATGRPPWSN